MLWRRSAEYHGALGEMTQSSGRMLDKISERVLRFPGEVLSVIEISRQPRIKLPDLGFFFATVSHFLCPSTDEKNDNESKHFASPKSSSCQLRRTRLRRSAESFIVKKLFEVKHRPLANSQQANPDSSSDRYSRTGKVISYEDTREDLTSDILIANVNSSDR